MSECRSRRDRAFEHLTAEFPAISVRVVLAMFLGYLEQTDSLPAAVEATRERIADACAV